MTSLSGKPHIHCLFWMNSQLGNMVMTGAYIKARETMFSADDLYDSVKTHIPPQKMNLAEKNIEMIKAGYEYDKC